MLKVIISPPGMGKTTYITEKIRGDAAIRGGIPDFPAPILPILIVPEQSHFETERMIYKKLGAVCFCNTEILSFTKLSAKIVSDSKKDKAPYAEDAVREIIMFKAALELREQLKFYGAASQKPDFAARMLSATGTFQREGISPRELSEAAAGIKNPRLKAKISDLAAIYERYVHSVSENFSDRPDEIRIAAELALGAKCFTGRNIYIDGFDGFTGGQFLLIEAMLEQAESVSITLTADKADTYLPHYKTTAKLIQKLKNAAEKRKIEVVTQNLSVSPMFPERSPKETEIYFLPDIYSESNFVGAKIRELITTKNYFQSQIAVLNAASPETLGGAFSAYGIKEFSDIPEAVIEKPMVKFIITVLEAAQNKPQSGAILSLIQSGFIRVSAAAFSGNYKRAVLRKITGKRIYDCARPQKKSYRLGRGHIKALTFAAREWQLDEKDWHTPFPNFRKRDTDTAVELIRAEITGKISALGERMQNTTGDKITEELADFLINDMELGRTVADIVYRGQKVSSALNDEYRNLWETVISILESMHCALKSQAISLRDYTAILTSIFGKTLIAKPPQVLDAVTVGDLRRTRTGGIKVAFLMGANRGEFPKGSFAGVEFTENETEELCEAGIFIEENRVDRYYRDKFLINRAMSLPTEKLYITAPLRDAAWKEKKVSRIVLDLNIKAVNFAGGGSPAFWASHENALKFRCAENPSERAYKDALYEIAPFEFTRLFAYGNKKDFRHKINSDDALTLLKRRSLSPSGIEKLNTCLFKYFCSEGLMISAGRIKNDISPDALTRGSMVHYVLERVLSDNEFIKLEPEKFTQTTERYIAEFEQKEFFGGYARSNRKKEILLMHAGGIAEVLRQMREDMKLSDFRPLEFEKSFEFMLGDILIKGKTDRLDILEDGDSRYVRVIDYKTGSKKFSYPEIEYGLNLQALIYLFAIASLDENYKPSGAFYRLVNGGKLSQKAKPYGVLESVPGDLNKCDLYKNRMETQSTTGIQFIGKDGETRHDYSDIEAINNELRQKSSANKDFIKLVNLEEDEFSLLAEKAAEQLKSRLAALYGGDVSAVPTYSGLSPCPYCDYRDICGNAGKGEEIKV
ncbi:MAG: PD-(D/E)XK nuclease family protein [Oscillospiraceae bacterium]|nr:PD-(D/E)XK nuclease family protein [Oscillospiraceae bacterium]